MMIVAEINNNPAKREKKVYLKCFALIIVEILTVFWAEPYYLGILIKKYSYDIKIIFVGNFALLSVILYYSSINYFKSLLHFSNISKKCQI